MSNPIMNDNTFQNTENVYIDQSGAMTINGTIYKSMFLLLIVCLGAAFSWETLVKGNSELAMILSVAGLIVGFILALIISFKRTLAPVLSPVYAAAEGLCLGAISASFEAQYPGIVFQAVVGTFAAMFSVLALYISRIIKVDAKVAGVIFAATLAVALMYLVGFILMLFHVPVAFLYDSSPLSIGISVVVIIIASANFLLDFNIIEHGVNSFAPKYMEWYCSFGLLVTLVWVYLEILKLLAKLSRRR